jgi:hypothetical protein
MLGGNFGNLLERVSKKKSPLRAAETETETKSPFFFFFFNFGFKIIKIFRFLKQKLNKKSFF